MRIECPGYRDPTDQKFCDESKSVVKRAQKSYKTLDRVVVAAGSGKPKHHGDDQPYSYAKAATLPSDSLQLLQLLQPIEDVAVAYFMATYIPGSHFDYLPRMYGQSEIGSCIHATVHAASIAILARKLDQIEVVAMARRWYIRALLETKTSLADPLVATNDTTLVSVLLLGLFEALIWGGVRTPDSWTTHTRGALALIKVRGTQQFHSETGRQLFFQVGNIICVNAIRQKTRLPKDFLDITAKFEQRETKCPKYWMVCMMGEVSALIADVEEGGMTAVGIVQAIITLDQRYFVFVQGLEPPWDYQKMFFDHSHPGMFNNTGHQYTSHRAVQLWNSYRMIRILINELLYKYAICLPSPSSGVLQGRAADNIQQMALDICASISRFIHPNASASLPQFCGDCSLTSAEFPVSVASILWPLSAVRGASLASEDLRLYATSQLSNLGRKHCISQAECVADDTEIDALHNGLVFVESIGGMRLTRFF
jgi:hypothetical protein